MSSYASPLNSLHMRQTAQGDLLLDVRMGGDTATSGDSTTPPPPPFSRIEAITVSGECATPTLITRTRVARHQQFRKAVSAFRHAPWLLWLDAVELVEV